MIRFFFICLALFILGCIAQQFIYGMQISYGVGKVLLVPLVFFCIASAQGYSATLVFAFMTGFAWDADHCLMPQSSPSPDVPPVDNLRFGYSIFLFGVMGFILKVLQGVIAFRGIIVSLFLVILVFLLYVVFDATLFYFIRGSYPQDSSIFRFLLESVGYTSILAPVLLIILGLSWKLLKSEQESPADSLTLIITKDSLQ